MKFAELKIKTKAELENILGKERERLRQFRFDIAGSKMKNTSELSKIKKLIAQILTLCQKSN